MKQKHKEGENTHPTLCFSEETVQLDPVNASWSVPQMKTEEGAIPDSYDFLKGRKQYKDMCTININNLSFPS